MRTAIILIAFMMSQMTAFAQKDSVVMNDKGITVIAEDGEVVKIGPTGIRVYDGDSVEVVIGGNDYDPNRNVRTRWILMDLGTDILMTEDEYRLENGLDPFSINAWKSTNVNLHLFQQRVNILNHCVNLKWGLAFEFHKYYFDNPATLDANTPMASFTSFQNTTFDKNRLMTSYLTLPLMLNFETNPKKRSKSFRINVGGYAGPRLGANVKTKLNGDKDKVRDDFNLNPWRYGARAEIGYGGFNFYATYNMSELFDPDKNNGYEVTPISIGVVLIPF